MTMATQVTPAPIVGEDEKNVGLFGSLQPPPKYAADNHQDDEGNIGSTHGLRSFMI